MNLFPTVFVWLHSEKQRNCIDWTEYGKKKYANLRLKRNIVLETYFGNLTFFQPLRNTIKYILHNNLMKISKYDCA